MESFRAAIKAKADGIELDVQMTLDGELVVIHDHQLERTTNGKGLVQQHTYRELRRYSAGAWFDPGFADAKIPRFEQVCALIAPTSLKLIVELKNFFLPQAGLEEKVIDTLQYYGLIERTVVSSFNFHSLQDVKRLMPELQTGMLYMGLLDEPWKIAAQFSANQLHAPKQALSSKLIAGAHAHHFPVIAWTVNHEKHLRQAFALHVAGVITNYPVRARKIRDKQKL